MMIARKRYLVETGLLGSSELGLAVDSSGVVVVVDDDVSAGVASSVLSGSTGCEKA